MQNQYILHGELSVGYTPTRYYILKMVLKDEFRQLACVWGFSFLWKIEDISPRIIDSTFTMMTWVTEDLQTNILKMSAFPTIQRVHFVKFFTLLV